MYAMCIVYCFYLFSQLFFFENLAAIATRKLKNNNKNYVKSRNHYSVQNKKKITNQIEIKQSQKQKLNRIGKKVEEKIKEVYISTKIKYMYTEREEVRTVRFQPLGAFDSQFECASTL